MSRDKQLRVVVVDEAPSVLSAIAKDLKGYGGVEVLTATSGPEAIAKVIAYRPHLVIVGHTRGSGLDGFGCLRGIRDQGFQGLIFLLASRADPPVLEEAVKAGADDCLSLGPGASVADEIVRLLGAHLESLLEGRALDRISEGGYFRSHGLGPEELAFLSTYVALGCPREKEICKLTGLEPNTVWRLMKGIRDKLGIDSTPKLARIVTLVELMGRRMA